MLAFQGYRIFCMYNKIRQELVWIFIFIMTQLALFLYNYRAFETQFYSAVGEITIVKEYKEKESKTDIVYVSFDKYRECEFVGLRMTDPYGGRVKFKFLDEDQEGDDSYLSRPKGLNVAGPWWVNYPNFEELQIEAIHKCDWFGYTVSLMQSRAGHN